MLRVAFSPPRRLAALKQLAAAALAVPPVARRAALTVSGIGLAYPRPHGAHPLVGPPRPGPAAQRERPARRGAARRLVRPRRPRVRDVEESAHLRIVEPARRLASTVLVRPDGYVAWAADGPTPAQVRDALREWHLTTDPSPPA